jgi:RNA-binding protein
MHLSNPEIRRLKAEAKRLEPLVRVGKSGLTPAVLQNIEQALLARSLIKVGLDHDRDEREVLAGQIAAATGAALIMQVGKVAVFYRPGAEKPTSPTDPR